MRNLGLKVSGAGLSIEEIVDEVAPSSEPEVCFRAAGECMLCCGVARAFGSWSEGFQNLARWLHSADVAHVHWEHPFGSHEQPYSKEVQPQLRSAPHLAPELAALGLDVVDLASNHTLDWGGEGIAETKRLFADLGVQTVGAGQDLAEALTPVEICSNGIRLGFLSYSAKGPQFHASTTSPGAAPLLRTSVLDQVGALKRRVEHVIVSVHWGIEFTEYPLAEDRSLARAMVDAGATLVIGTHPHVVQGVEAYHEGVICYSAGHFLYDPASDQAGSEKLLSARRIGLGLQCYLTPSRVREVIVFPLRINDASQPEFARGKFGLRICEHVLDLSESLDERVGSAEFYEQAVLNLWTRTLLAYRLKAKKYGWLYTARLFLSHVKPRYFQALGGFLVMRVRRLSLRTHGADQGRVK